MNKPSCRFDTWQLSCTLHLQVSLCSSAASDVALKKRARAEGKAVIGATAAFLFCVARGKGLNELMLPDSDLVRFLLGINRMRGKTAKLLAFARRVFSASSFRVLLVPGR